MLVSTILNAIYLQIDHLKSYNGDQSILGAAEVFLLQFIEVDG